MEVELEKMREILAVYEQRDADKQHEIDPQLCDTRTCMQQTNGAAPFAEEEEEEEEPQPEDNGFKHAQVYRSPSCSSHATDPRPRTHRSP